MLFEDPYQEILKPQLRGFIWKKIYIGSTNCGFKVKYTISCLVDIIDRDEFRLAGMSHTANQEKLVDDWHSEIFVPKFKELRYSFRYLVGWDEWDHGNPCLCRIAEEGGEEFVFFDHNSFELRKELKKISPLEKNGCRAKFFSIEMERNAALKKDEPLIQENFDMIKLRGLNSPQNTEAFRTWEEAVMISMYHRHAELEKEFLHLQANQRHESKMISIETRLVGSSVEVKWDFSKYKESDYVLRGHRKEDGFVTNDHSGPANGMCVVETQAFQGKVVQNLKQGNEYFFTFQLAREDPIYAEQKFPQSILNSPQIVGSQTKIADTLRFSIQIPTQAEMMRVEQLIEKAKTRPIDPKREKIDRAIEALTSFVEFEESISEVESTLMKRIKSKGYSEDEAKNKMERLKGLVELIQIREEI
jgi:hypothetical protein